MRKAPPKAGDVVTCVPVRLVWAKPSHVPLTPPDPEPLTLDQRIPSISIMRLFADHRYQAAHGTVALEPERSRRAAPWLSPLGHLRALSTRALMRLSLDFSVSLRQNRLSMHLPQRSGPLSGHGSVQSLPQAFRLPNILSCPLSSPNLEHACRGLPGHISRIRRVLI